MRTALTLIGLLAIFGLGFFVAWQWARPSPTYVEETSADVLLERVETVAKMVTLEGHFSEVYAHQDFRRLFNTPYWDALFMDLPGFQKKALIRVKGKVLVGYDLEQMRVEVDADTRTITLSNLPEPTILSTEHDLEYFDLSEGAFNAFTERDYNRINAKAKALIIEEARHSNLFERAEAQGIELLDMISFLAEESGWKVVRPDRPALAN